MMRLLRLALLSLMALLTCLTAAELGRRILDGYRVFGVGLVKDPNSTDLTWSDEHSTEALLRTIKLDIEADRSWFYDRPMLSQTTPPEWAEIRREDFDAQVNYVWNAARLNDTAIAAALGKYRDRLDEIFLFRAPRGSLYPFYRFYPEIQSGFLRTNRFGWMSGPIADQKPPDVIRIGFIGDSTTLTYPGMVEHWLNLWSARRNLGVRFEVMNAARPGTGALDAVAILEFELGPADPDYVIIYGFGNGIYVADDLIALPPGIIKGQPATWTATKPGSSSALSKRVGLQLEPVARWSAAAAFLRDRITDHGSALLPEPPKPATEIVFPPGIDEASPNPETIASRDGNSLMVLQTFLQSLDKMNAVAKARDIRLLISTFRVIAFDGMRARDNVYKTFNESFWWPYTYAQIHRFMAFYNRTLRAWAETTGQGIIPVDEQMPWRPELYGDGMHEMPAGMALHAWIVLQDLMPRIRDDLAKHRLPRPAQHVNRDVGQYWTIERAKLATVLDAGPRLAPALPFSPPASPAASDDIPGAFLLSRIVAAYTKAQVVPGAVPLITTAPEPSGYAAAVPSERSVTTGLTGKGWLSVRLKIREGGVTVGILTKSGQGFQSYSNLNRMPDIQEVRLMIDDLSDVGSFVVANNRPGQKASSVVELHGVVLKRIRK